jgi:hypothetical protein
MMLQVAFLLLACGLCRHMWSISTPVACTLISLADLGVIFFIRIVITGMSSYACPFQTQVSGALCGIWKADWRRIVPSIIYSKQVLSWMWNQRVQPLLCRQSPPAIPLENIQVQQSEPVSMPNNASQPELVSMPDISSQSEPALMPAARSPGHQKSSLS